MKYIEDCLEKLDHIVSVFPISTTSTVSVHPSSLMSGWDFKFVSDVSAHTIKGSPLSSKQALVTTKLLTKYVHVFPAGDQAVVLSLLSNPEYRKPLFQSIDVPREIRWIGGSIVLLRFPFNAMINADLKSINNCISGLFQKRIVGKHKTWRVIVDHTNYKSIMDLVQRHNFQFDDDTLNFFLQVNNNIDKPNAIKVNQDTIDVEINNDVMAVTWLANMEWLRNV